MNPDRLSKYYERICRTPLLSETEELELCRVYRNESNPWDVRQNARTRLAEANLRFVFKTARGYARRDPGGFADFISAGNEGLLVGIDKFNPEEGVKLLTYAGHWVHQRILDHMCKLRTVRLPVWKQQLAARIKKFRDANPGCSVHDVIEFMPTVREKDVRELFETQYLSFSLDEMVENGEDFCNGTGSPADENIQSAQILEKVKSLPPQVAMVVIECFGLMDGKEKKISEVVAVTGLSRDNVKKLKKQGLDMLRNVLTEDDL